MEPIIFSPFFVASWAPDSRLSKMVAGKRTPILQSPSFPFFLFLCYRTCTPIPLTPLPLKTSIPHILKLVSLHLSSSPSSPLIVSLFHGIPNFTSSVSSRLPLSHLALRPRCLKWRREVMRKSRQKLFENVEELFEPETILEEGTGQVVACSCWATTVPLCLQVTAALALSAPRPTFRRRKRARYSQRRQVRSG